jgi:SnoaL-like polyketide cyclase
VACRLVFDCTPQREFLGFIPDGRRLAFAEHVFYRFDGGRIAAVWSLIDRAAIAEQLGRWRRGELDQQRPDASVDVVPYGADLVEGLSGGVGEVPVEVAPSGEDGAGVAAAHRDDDVRGLDGIGGEDLGMGVVEVDAELGHRGAYDGVDLVGGR